MERWDIRLESKIKHTALYTHSLIDWFKNLSGTQSLKTVKVSDYDVRKN